MSLGNDDIKIIALKEMERIFTELKGDFYGKDERYLFQSIQDKISYRIIELEENKENSGDE
jgi:hypothetical protein